jgi:hypothetical protein
MTSLATLAHTVPAPPPFNGLFYATAATIIPVLFLAIAVATGHEPVPAFRDSLDRGGGCCFSR